MDFLTNLKELREEKGITQKELAKACNLSPQCISSLEKGINSPTAITLNAIANYFNVTVDYLIGREPFTAAEQAGGISEKTKTNITTIEEEMLTLFREIGQKHGEKAQRALITVAESMI